MVASVRSGGLLLRFEVHAFLRRQEPINLLRTLRAMDPCLRRGAGLSVHRHHVQIVLDRIRQGAFAAVGDGDRGAISGMKRVEADR